MKAALLSFLAFLGIALLVGFAGKAGLEILTEILPPDTLPYALALLVNLAILIMLSVSRTALHPQMPIHHKREAKPNILFIVMLTLVFSTIWFMSDRYSALGKLMKAQTEQIKLQEEQIQSINMMMSSAQSACSR
jgi:TRAP-type C4-dicarboxylate transport system permease small subunit